MVDEECVQTFDMRHHYGPRKWLMRDANGKSRDPNFKDNWYEEWACVCGALAPSHLIPALKEQLRETNRIKSRRWGHEQAMQGKLAL